MMSWQGWLIGAALNGAADAAELVVVYEGGDTVPAAPYVVSAEVSETQSRAAVAAATARLAATGLRQPSLPEVFPVAPGPLRAGAPVRQRMRGLPQPVFAVGADAASLDWLAAHGTALRERGAVGVCVAARTAAEFAAVRALARGLGLELVPLQGAAFAVAYGVAGYPVLVEPAP